MAQYDEPEVDFDLDALQAQINMAMAETEELVSSWVQPSETENQRPKKSMEEMEKELQEYLRRPPRLGVGAPIPDSVGPSAREEAKLKNRLVGNDRKRKREEEVASSKVDEDFDDDEESKKGESTTKVARIDPFSLPKKKMKKAVEMDRAKPSKLAASVPVLPVVNGVLSPKPAGAQAKATNSSAVSNQTTKPKKQTKPASTSTVTTMDTTPVLPMNGALNPQAPPHDKVISAQAEEAKANSSLASGVQRNHNDEVEEPSSVPISNGVPHLHSLAIMNGISASTSTASSSQGPPSERQPSTEVSPYPPQQASQDAPPSPTTNRKKKKKKKKKKRRLELEQEQAANANGITVPPVPAPSEISTTNETDDTNTAVTSTTNEKPRTSPMTSGTASEENPSVNKNEEFTLDDLDVKISINDSQKVKNADHQDKPNGTVPSSRIKRNRTSSSSPQNQPRAVPIPIPIPIQLLLPGPGPPLLNLNGPPPDADNDNASSQSPISPSKKKKRRRHKRKNRQNMSDGMNGVNGMNEENGLNGTNKVESKP